MTDREKRIKKAGDMFIEGYNCAQATSAPFHDIVGMDEESMIKASSAFGGGVAKLRNVCGVVSGIALVFGLSKPGIDVSDADAKSKRYEEAQEVISRFSDKNDTVICAQLLEELEKNPPKEEPYASKQCLGLVEDGAAILCDFFGIK